MFSGLTHKLSRSIEAWPVKMIGIAILYFITAKLSLLMAFEHTNASAVWPPTGIALSAALLFGQRIWPAIMAGAFLANFWTLTSLGFSLPMAITVSLGTAIGNTLEALIGRYLIQRSTGGCNPFYRFLDVMKFVAFGALISPIASASIGTGSFCFGSGDWANFASIWLTWWLGDAIGAIVIVPLVLTWKKRELVGWNPMKIAEMLLLLALLFVLGRLVFSGSHPYPFLFLLPMIWVVMRFGQFESSCAILLISVTAIARTLTGSGPFVNASLNVSLLELQGYIGTISLTIMVLSSVISERKSVVESLRMGEASLREAQRTAQIGSWSWDATTDTIWWSDEYYKVFNFAPATPPPKYSEHLKAYTTDSAERLDAAVKMAMQSGEPYELDLELADPSGTTRWISARGEPKRGADGRVIGLCGTAQNITERMETEKAQRLLSAVVESSDDAIISKELDGTILSWNVGAEKIYGYSAGEVVGKPISLLVPPDMSDEIPAILERLKKGEVITHYETERLRKDGVRIVVSITVSPIRDAAGKVFAASTIARDITERKRSEHDLALMLFALNHVRDEVYLFNEDARISFVNEEACRMLGYERAELLRLRVGDIDQDLTMEAWPEHWREMKLRGSLVFESRHRAKDGRLYPVEISVSSFDYEGLPYALGLARDISQRRQAEKDLRESEHKYRALIETTDTGYVIVDSEGIVLDANPEYVRLTGHNGLEEIVGKSVVEWTAGEDRERNLQAIKRCLELGHTRNFELRYSGRDGLTTPVEINATVIRDSEGSKILTVCREITERKRAEESLRAMAAYNRSLIEASLDPLVTIGSDGKITDVNAATEAVTGYERSKLIGTDFSSYFTEPERARAGYEQVFLAGFVRDYPLDIEHRNGAITSVLYNASVYKDETGNIIGVFAAARDITERKEVEEALREKDTFIRNILETVDEGFIVVDRELRILSANRAYCDSANLNGEQVLGRTCHEVAHQTDKPCFETGEECPVIRAFKTGLPCTASHTHPQHGGEKRYVEIKAFPIMGAAGNVVSVIETVNDITERKHLEEQLRHAQKLESLGTLSGGIAHDFNNILNVIVGYGGLMEMRMAKDDPNLPSLREILVAAERATHLTQSLLIFGRKQITEMKQININELIEGMRKMILRLIGEDIDTDISLTATPKLIVMGDYGQIEQVLMNLATNARDAMPDGGSLRIKTELRELDKESLASHGGGKPGKYALISVSDTGEGMDEATREKIFEPFFTTKGVGRGTGLGLSIAYGIVKQHNGLIDCQSFPGRGTTFKIYLPVVREEPHEREKAVTRAARRGSETILIADDDETIRKFTADLLAGYGYTVIVACDGADAVDKFIANKEQINLALLDVIMPKKSGKEAFEEIRRIQPNLKVLFFSGYNEDIIQRKRIIEDNLPLLLKPANPNELLARIREIMDAKN